MKNYLNKMDCTFYFLIREKDKTVTLKEEIQETICEAFCHRLVALADIKNYTMRSGPGVRSSLMLKNEWSDTIPEKIEIFLVDRETEVATLLSWTQRNMFFNMVMKSTEDLDTLSIAEYVLNEIEADAEDL